MTNVIYNDMCGSCMCANLNEFPIYLKEEFKRLIKFLTSYNSNMYNNIYMYPNLHTVTHTNILDVQF